MNKSNNKEAESAKIAAHNLFKKNVSAPSKLNIKANQTKSIEKDGKLEVLNEMLERDFATKNNNWLNFRTREGGKINLKTLHVLWQLIEIANRNNSDLIEMSLTGLIEEAFNGTCSFNQLVLHLTALESIGAIDRISAGVRRKGAIKINFERIKMLEVNQMKMERA